MTRGRELKASDIGYIAYLSKARHTNKYISDTTGIPLRTVQQCTNKFCDNRFNDIDPPL